MLLVLIIYEFDSNSPPQFKLTKHRTIFNKKSSFRIEHVIELYSWITVLL
jgi:hypothetical protein